MIKNILVKSLALLTLVLLFACSESRTEGLDNSLTTVDGRTFVFDVLAAEDFRATMNPRTSKYPNMPVKLEKFDSGVCYAVQGNKFYRLNEAAKGFTVVEGTNDRGFGAKVRINIRKEIDLSKPFRLIGAMGHSDLILDESNNIWLTREPAVGVPMDEFNLPLYFVLDVEDLSKGLPKIQFKTYGTYELSFLRNDWLRQEPMTLPLCWVKAGVEKAGVLTDKDLQELRPWVKANQYFNPIHGVVKEFPNKSAKMKLKPRSYPLKAEGKYRFVSWSLAPDALPKEGIQLLKLDEENKAVYSNVYDKAKSKTLLNNYVYHLSARLGYKIGFEIIGGEEITFLELEQTELKMNIVNSEKEYRILRITGSGQYDIKDLTPNVVTASIEGKELTVRAVAAGSTSLEITDLKTNEKVTLSVTVSEKGGKDPQAGGNGNYPAEDKVFVEGGSFDMGSNDGDSDEKPIHRVTVKDFYIGKYEVTNLQYADFLNAMGNQSEGGVAWLDINSLYCQIISEEGGFRPKDGKENHPVMVVSWYGAKAYAEWVGGRLPSEAEWEYAARGGNKSKGYKYSGSNNIDDVAWYYYNTGNEPLQVGTKQANELGIYDMSGNVWEWCQDTWHGSYTNAPTDGSAWLKDGESYRVLRGGSWYLNANYCRVANRNYYSPTYRSSYYGFRVCWGVGSSGK